MDEDRELEELLRRFRDGNSEAKTLLIERLYPIGRKWLSKHASKFPLEDREDILQDAIAALSAGLHRIRATTAAEFRGYFFMILRTKLIDYDRKKKQTGAVVPLEEEHLEPKALEQGFGKIEVDEILRRCLSPRECQVVLLKLEGSRDREVARILGVDPGTVAKLWHRAREKLRRCLGRQETG